MGVRSSVAALLAVGLCGCAAPHVSRPDWARLGNTSTAEGGPVYHRDPHHQYFDKSHDRYYYYDLTQKRFFWENGQPKS